MRAFRRNKPLRSLIGYVVLPRLDTGKYILLWSGLAIHLLTIYVGWVLGGWWAACLSAIFPFAAQAYWVLHIWQTTGSFLSFLTILCVAYAFLWIAAVYFKLK